MDFPRLEKAAAPIVGWVLLTTQAILSPASAQTIDDTVRFECDGDPASCPNLTLHGDVTTGRDRQDGKALQFPGTTDSYAEWPNFGDDPRQFAAEAWVYPATLKRGTFHTIMRRRGRGNQWQFWIRNDRLHLNVWDDRAENKLPIRGRTGPIMAEKRWQHVAFQVDGEDTWSLFVDGNLVAEGVPEGAAGSGRSPVTVGREFHGRIDEIRLYDGLLPQKRLETVREEQQPWTRDISVADALDFEVAGAWNTAPVELLDLMSAGKLWSARPHGTGDGLRVPSVPFKTLAGGLTISGECARSGRFGALWTDRVTYPTLACRVAPRDWSSYDSFQIDVHTEHATGEVITVGILSDSEETPWRDYYTREVTVNWKGWTTVRIPLSDFVAYEQPEGWEKVDAVYLFAKAGGHQPNPHNALSLDNVRLTEAEHGASSGGAAGNRTRKNTAENDFIYVDDPSVKPLPLNHDFPEAGDRDSFTAGTDYIVHEPYYRCERALYKYFPRYNPGRPSFNPDGKAFIKAGDRIQWLDADGQWVTSDLRPVLTEWAGRQGWKGLLNRWTGRGEGTIRFDADGDAYVLELVEQLDEDGKDFDWHTRTGLLLHSRDGMRSWDVYRLPGPGRTACFERIDGHNHDALQRPPVILLSDYKYFGDADQAGYITIPEKQADGTLVLPEAVAYASGCISAAGRHSGDGNSAITIGNKVYITYGWMPHQGDKEVMARYRDPVKAYMERVKKDGVEPGTWGWDKQMAEEAGMPPIPEDHPMLDMQYPKKTHWKFTGWSRNGVPTYVVTYDIETREVSDPVYVGSGGLSIDNHNWSAITVDSKGILHVIINGHIDPVVYTHSLKPYDISQWSDPVYVGSGKYPGLSYGSLNCDADDTLYMFNRSDTFAYNHRLAMYRKPAGKSWGVEKTILAPFQSGYHVWWHRAAYDHVRDRLFFTFRYDPGVATSRDMYEFHAFQYPFREKERHGEEGPPAPGEFRKIFWEREHRGFTVLVSSDQGHTWRLATTADFNVQ